MRQLKTLRRPPIYPNRARTIAFVTSRPPSSVLTPSIRVHRWIRAYLEARGLLASTLADLIVLTHAEAMDCQNVMEEEDFNTQILPALQAAITCIELPGLSDQLRERALQELKGTYRHTFPQAA